MKKIEVVAAIICKDNKVFCTQRPDKGEVALKWEFPGGKIELTETKKDALIREIMEELRCSIRVKKFFSTVEYQYNSFFLTMHSYICEMKSNNFELMEHIDCCWLPIDRLNELDWAPADIPIVTKLINDGLT